MVAGRRDFVAQASSLPVRGCPTICAFKCHACLGDGSYVLLFRVA